MATLAQRKKYLYGNPESESITDIAGKFGEAPIDYSKGTYYGGGELPSVSKEGQIASGVDSASNVLGGLAMIPTPASPFLAGAGLALKVGSGIYQAVKGNEAQEKADKKAEEDRAQTKEKYIMERNAYLAELIDANKKKSWNRQFTNAFLGGK